MDFDKLLQLMIKKNGSDLFITANVAPSMKVNGTICPIGQTPLTAEQTMILVKSIMTDAQKKEFDETHECQFAISDKAQQARFRSVLLSNVIWQRWCSEKSKLKSRPLKSLICRPHLKSWP